LSGLPIPFPTPTPNPFTTTGTYVVQANDTLASIADHFGVSVEALMQANGITKNQVFTGVTLVIPNQQTAPINELIGNYRVQEGDTLSMIAQNYGTTIDELIRLNSLTETTIYIGQNLYVPITETTTQRMEDLRGYLSISIHKKTDGSSFKEYILDVTQNTGSIIYTLDGSSLDEMDPHNGLPILVTGTINPTGKLLVESYKIPYPDLQFQILKGTQKIEQLGGQMVTVFTTEDGKSYVEYLMTNNIPNSSITGYEGDLIQQEVLIIPDEIFSGMPVAHIYQSAIVQENGPEMQIRGNLIPEFPEPDPNMPGDYPQPNLTINLVELAYFVSNPYYQVNDPNYDQRSPYIQPVWHFHGRYDDGTEFDVLIQALKQEFLLPEVVPNAGIG
jgi:LysM repeat protein